MQLRHFHYFIALAEAGSFVKAARQLQVSQPSLSTQIQALEREIGVALFERRSTGVRLTAAGSAFLVEARSTLENAARAVARARVAGNRLTTELRLVYGRMVHHMDVLRDLLAAFHALHPETDVHVRPMDESRQHKALREHRADAAVVFVGRLPIEGFASQILEDCVITGILLPIGHPLAARECVSLAALRDSPWFHLPRQAAPESFRILRAALVQRGLNIERHAARPTDIGAVAVHMTARGGWMLASEGMAASFARGQMGLVYRPFTDEPIPYWLKLIWREDDDSPLIRDLTELAGRLRPHRQMAS